MKASEQSLRALLDQLPAILWTTDAALRFTSSRGAGLEALGRKPGEVVGRALADVVGEDPDGEPHVAVQAARRALAGEATRYVDGFSGRRYDVWVQPLRDSRGIVCGTVGTAVEITERERAQEMLRRQADFSQRLIDSSVDGILAFDRECRITIWNPAMECYTGWSEAEVLGRPVFQIFPHLSESGDDQPFHDALAGRTSIARDKPFTSRAGRHGFFEGHFSPILDHDGSVLGGLAVVRDRTEHRHLEEQLRQAQKLEAVGRLAGGVAHDFSNILTVISGRSELLLDALPARDARHGHAQEILEAARKAARLTRQLLTFSRRQVIQPRLLCLNSVLADMTTLLGRLLGDAVALDLDPAAELWPVRADPSQVEQVLLNLALNARDAMPQGGRVSVRTANIELDEAYTRRRVDAQKGPHVLIEVTDTGSGMDAGLLEHIFEPFFTTKKQGTGLGLATVYGIVRQSGGHLTVESEPGRGSTFRVFLPRADGPAEGADTRQPGPTS